MTRHAPSDETEVETREDAPPAMTGLAKVAYVVAIVGPLTTVPQIVQIYGKKSAEDISIAAWVGFSLYSAFWMYYGATRKDWPLALANGFWTVLQLIVLIGALLYR